MRQTEAATSGSRIPWGSTTTFAPSLPLGLHHGSGFQQNLARSHWKPLQPHDPISRSSTKTIRRESRDTEVPNSC
ncbi:Hypothetical predicted protein [Podarcis lilfordi]|uniref:Uncharacterized protein n=1 Tax=Podarcis lilfordi TaxID=74358 RepID=A0AA35KZF4_9SAUR|nr:Hypothetical predicted protein [Podarcis lilfordi]